MISPIQKLSETNASAYRWSKVSSYSLRYDDNNRPDANNAVILSNALSAQDKAFFKHGDIVMIDSQAGQDRYRNQNIFLYSSFDQRLVNLSFEMHPDGHVPPCFDFVKMGCQSSYWHNPNSPIRFNSIVYADLSPYFEELVRNWKKVATHSSSSYFVSPYGRYTIAMDEDRFEHTRERYVLNLQSLISQNNLVTTRNPFQVSLRTTSDYFKSQPYTLFMYSQK